MKDIILVMLVKYGQIYMYTLQVRSTVLLYNAIHTCMVTILFAGPPILVSKGDQTVMVSVSEELILNCTASASPDPVYSWSFPDSCSSCPNISNDNVLIFTVEDITDSGEYTCVAENEYGNISITFNVSVISK